MFMGANEKKIRELLSYADVRINGDRPWDIQVHNPKLYSRVLRGGTLALGESYMDGWWDCEALDQFFDKVISAKLIRKVSITPFLILSGAIAMLSNVQRLARAFVIGKKHYDIGNNLFSLMLDKRMNYSCGYWENAKNLDEAQEEKLKLICRKIGLKPGMKVLDIGSGWGGFLKYAAENHGVEGVGVTVSKEQAELSRNNLKGLPVEIKLQDYRYLEGKFDRIVSIGMFEHVGYKNYKTFMKVAHRNLKSDGLFLLHTIGSKKSRVTGDLWIDKYIFPGGVIPSIKQLAKAAEGLFVIEDIHNFGADYDKTLMAWHSNFNKNWDKIKQKYDKGDGGERFKRMWNYYLLSSASTFRSRRNQLWQLVLSKDGIRGGYKSIR